MGVVLGSVMGQGFLARRADDEIAKKPMWLAPERQQQLLAYYKLLDDTGLSPVEMCLRFAISDPDISTIPIGCKTLEQLEQSVLAVSKGPLNEDILGRLNTIATMVPNRPFEEPMILPIGKRYYGPGIANMGAAVQVGKV
jgi:aryl-alcohol dehydrogenase-like predicted oxidoreductase